MFIIIINIVITVLVILGAVYAIGAYINSARNEKKLEEIHNEIRIIKNNTTPKQIKKPSEKSLLLKWDLAVKYIERNNKDVFISLEGWFIVNGITKKSWKKLVDFKEGTSVNVWAASDYLHDQINSLK